MLMFTLEFTKRELEIIADALLTKAINTTELSKEFSEHPEIRAGIKAAAYELGEISEKVSRYLDDEYNG